MNIHQVSVSYVNEQDRLLMRINMQNAPGGQASPELRLWLTRRLTLALLPALQGHAGEQLSRSTQLAQSAQTAQTGQTGQAGEAPPATPIEVHRQRLLDAFKLEAAAYDGDFKTPYREPASPPAAQNTPMLVMEVVIALQASGQLQMKFSQKLEGGAGTRDVELGMQPQLTQGLLHLLNLSVQQSGWLDIPARGPAQTQEPDPLAALAALEKPSYLN